MSGDGDTDTFTTAVKGTAAYMPPEAINCDVSAKWDIWSYGVVLLELVTGLPVMDRNREDHDLVRCEIRAGFIFVQHLHGF